MKSMSILAQENLERYSDGGDEAHVDFSGKPVFFVPPKDLYESVQYAVGNVAVTDSIVISDVDIMNELATFWMPEEQNKNFRDIIYDKGTVAIIPTDIILQRTVPIVGMTFDFSHISDISKYICAMNTDVILGADVVLFEGWERFSESYVTGSIEEFNDDNKKAYTSCIISAIVLRWNNSLDDLIIPIHFVPWEQELTFDSMVIFKNIKYHEAKEMIKFVNVSYELADLFISVVFILSIWYGCQLAMLHPATVTIFQNPEYIKRSREDRLKQKSKKKSSVKYVKRHVIKQGAIKEALIEAATAHGQTGGESQRAYERHTLLWRVIGHYRTYSNGKKVWIKPHWKGALKDFQTKKVIVNNREVDIPSVEK